jgi:hypothetical protein
MMPSDDTPPAEWLATTAAKLYTIEYEHFVRTATGGAEFPSADSMARACETAYGLWAKAQDVIGAREKPRQKTGY